MSALADRDTNAQMASNKAETHEKPKVAGTENKSQRSLQQQIANSNATGDKYISPSDAILSPASQKLAGFKQRQMNKQNGNNPTARSLFSRTASSVSGASLDDSEDITSK
ncbi:hypothetical protein DOTSEDRAFT_173806 [Dothistroma septosporum NZE10]|uniref:Uncharacterized protein n=1 Tax=Dothistroma septosporum (strain NZE10 / CBS 128990) TaxID=675120 RepID=M2WM70_DOTSN|nr:hypothetical protein DOTSEDRAFT_173806 [Dothistroma septosporum NZE10]